MNDQWPCRDSLLVEKESMHVMYVCTLILLFLLPWKLCWSVYILCLIFKRKTNAHTSDKSY